MDSDTVFSLMVMPGDIVYDIGANIGQSARVLAEATGSQGKVFCFEPLPLAYAELKNMLSSLPATTSAFPFAVSDVCDEVLLYYSKNVKAREASTICSELANQERFGEAIETIKVKTITIDTFCEHEKMPDFVKIDVEGAEAKVLRGMLKTLEKAKPTIYFESGIGLDETVVPEHYRLLRDCGYILYVANLIRFTTRPPSWEHILTSSNRKLANKIFTFSDDDLLRLRPVHTNILAVSRGDAKRKAAGFSSELETAVGDLTKPRKSFRAKYIKYVPEPCLKLYRPLKKFLNIK